MATLRRAKWQPPQQQVKLESLLGPPVVLLNSGRERSLSSEEEGDKLGIWEDKSRFQAQILRAECKFLRMERQSAVRRSNRERVSMETTLKSALHSLISAQRKVGEGQNVSSVLQDEIKELAKKLAEIQTLSKKTTTTRRDSELLKDGSPRFQVEILTRKMECMSEGMFLKKMENEYGSMLTRTANSSAANSQRYDQLDLSFSSSPLQRQEKNVGEQKICAGKCKVVVRRIMEQVRAETEQWSEMQKMVGKVRQEMEHLQASRDFWEARAVQSESKIQSLNATVKEWKQRALSLEMEKQLHPQEKEQRVLTVRVKGEYHREDESWRKERGNNRQPLRNIGNCTYRESSF